MARRDYEGNAVGTELTGAINNTDLTINIALATGWPTGGANGKFVVTIDRGLSTEERILVASRTGTVLTVAAIGDRGVDGTTAQSHSINASIEHTFAAIEADEANEHVNDTTKDHHTQYLNNARHDTTGRHTAGTVVPTAVVGTIQPDDVAAEGVATSLARSDHKHAITTAVPGSITPDDVAAEGAATSFSRSDHTHGITTDVPSDVGTANAEGASGSFSRADHTHNLPDNIVTTAKILDDAVTAAKLANALPRGEIGFDGTLADSATSGSTPKVITGLSVTTPVLDANRKIKVTLDIHKADGSAAGDQYAIQILEDGVAIGYKVFLTNGAVEGGPQVIGRSIPTAAAHTYTATVTRLFGTGALTVFGSGSPAPQGGMILLVEDIGGS